MRTPPIDPPPQLDHVAVAVPTLTAGARVVAGALGARPFEGGPGAGFRWAQYEFAGGARLELLEPDGPAGGFLHRFLDRHGPGVHHVTFKVPSLAAAAGRAREFGYEIVGYDDRFPGWKEAFLHPKQAQGIVVQMAESDPAYDDGSGRRFAFPEVEPERPGPVALRGVLLAAASEAAARRQWEELLGGRAAPSPAGLVFRWPDSPLAIVVRVEPEREPGPRALLVDPADLADVPADAAKTLGVGLEPAPPAVVATAAGARAKGETA